MTTTLVVPEDCPRCGGSGKVIARRAHHGVPGLCFRCEGAGQVETDPVTLAAQEAERVRAIAKQKADNDRYNAWRTFEFDAPFAAVCAAHALRDREPQRFEKLLDSLVARRADIIPALLAYATTIGS